MRIVATLFLVAVTCNAMASFAQPGPNNPKVIELQQKSYKTEELENRIFPDGVSHDFGKVQNGIKVYHSFRIVNNSNKPMRILEVRVSMNRSLRAWVNKDTLQPNEETALEIAVDTRMFVGEKIGVVFVRVDGKEYRVWKKCESCDNLVFFPSGLEFGKIKQGETPTVHMVVTVPDQPKLKLTAANCDSKYVDVKVQELDRGMKRSFYQISATVRGDIPLGKIYASVELMTNNPAMPMLTVPLTGEVLPAQ